MTHHDIKTLKAAQEITGKLSNRNSKMPGSTFAISAKHCGVGGKLVNVKGSVCDRCYAIKLQKLRPSVDKGWTDNYLAATRMIATSPDKWAAGAAFQINRMAKKSGEMFHRWFDSGDLASVDMLGAICKAAELTPDISHWLPTREAKIVKDFRAAGGVVPANLIIRISSTMIGDKPISGHANTSTVHRKGDTPAGHICPASKQGGNCGACRACWTHTVANVSYPLH
jgi:hypothetical protein